MKAFLAFVLWSLLWSGIQRLLAKFQSDSAIYASADGVLRTSCIIWDVCKFTSNLSKNVPILSGLYTDYTVFPNLYHTAPRKQISRTIWVAGLKPQFRSSPSSHSGFPHSREWFLMQHTTAGLQGTMLNMFLYPLTRLEMVSSRTDCDLHNDLPEIYHRTSPHCRRCWGTGVLSASTHPIWLAAQCSVPAFLVVLSLVFAGRSLEISSICSEVFVPPVTSECSQLPRLVVLCHGLV